MHQYESHGVPRLFYSQATPASVRIGVRLSDAAAAGCVLSGRVSGPFCHYAHTLPTNSPLVRAEPDALCAEAIVPDPCYWSAELPMIYRVSVELRDDEQVVQSWNFDYGMRALQAQRHSFYLEGRRWVMRGVCVDRCESFDAGPWRDASAVMMLVDPDEDVCREASEKGVWLIARFTAPTANLTAKLQRLTRWPAVAMVVFDSNVKLDDEARQTAGNVILAQQLGADSAMPVSPWAKTIVAYVDDQSMLPEAARSATLPVIAVRRVATPSGDVFESLSELRHECDLLQRDLAKQGDFAGYLVEPTT